MARTYRARLVGLMSENERRMAALFQSLAGSIAGEIARAAGPDDMVPIGATYRLQRAAGDRVAAFFVGLVAGEWAPLQVLPDGSALPLAPYVRALWESIEAAMRVSVEQQAALMAARLPPDLVAHLRRARRDPFTLARRVGEQRVFTPNPLAQYDPPHTWVDPAGYTLSDRIWRTAGDTRRRLDLFLEQRIRAGQGALAMSRDLEAFLLPGRRLVRTKAPYGTDASYDAMRLARTEITRAAARAAEVSAAMNPFVQGIRLVLSGSHPEVDICDEAAAAGPWPKDKIPPEYQIPLHPHCLCSYRYVMANRPGAILEELREDVSREQAQLVSLIGPLQVEAFLRLLLGRGWSVRRSAEAAA